MCLILRQTSITWPLNSVRTYTHTRRDESIHMVNNNHPRNTITVQTRVHVHRSIFVYSFWLLIRSNLVFFFSLFLSVALNGGNEAWSPTSTNGPSDTPLHNASSFVPVEGASCIVGGKINNTTSQQQQQQQQQMLISNQLPASNALHNSFLASSVRDTLDMGHCNSKINNHHQLRNNLLSSSVRDLMSTLSNRGNHTVTNNTGGPQSSQVSTSTPSSQGTYGPLIVTGNNGNNLRDVYGDSQSSTGPTCLVRSQSGSRYIFSSKNPTENMTNSSILPPASLLDHNAIIIRPSGTIGTTSRLTLGSKIINSHGTGGINRSTSSSTGVFSTLSLPMRFNKSLSHLSCNWRCTTLLLFLISLITFFALIYTINYRQMTTCSCPLSIESTQQSVIAGNYKTLVHSTDGDAYNNVSPIVTSSSSSSNGITSSQCPILCSGRGQYLKGICHCPIGWKGKECELHENECEISDCTGHGVCINGKCNCTPGYTGNNCEIETCPTLCSNRGLYDKGSCKCNPGYKGKDCELRVDQCYPANCSNHGACVNGNCICNPGWKGSSCSQGKFLCE